MFYDLNSLPNDKIVDWSKFKALADDKIYVTQNLNFVLEKLENILGRKRRKYWLAEFSLFSQNVFKSPISQGR